MKKITFTLVLLLTFMVNHQISAQCDPVSNIMIDAPADEEVIDVTFTPSPTLGVTYEYTLLNDFSNPVVGYEDISIAGTPFQITGLAPGSTYSSVVVNTICSPTSSVSANAGGSSGSIVIGTYPVTVDFTEASYRALENGGGTGVVEYIVQGGTLAADATFDIELTNTATSGPCFLPGSNYNPTGTNSGGGIFVVSVTVMMGDYTIPTTFSETIISEFCDDSFDGSFPDFNRIFPLAIGNRNGVGLGATQPTSEFVIVDDETDNDGDGVRNAPVNADDCPGTTFGLSVDSDGCATVAAIVDASDDPADGGFDIDDLNDLPAPVDTSGLTPGDIPAIELAIAQAMPQPATPTDIQNIITGTLSVNSIDVLSKIRLIPNPAISEISVNGVSSENNDIIIYNILGSKVLQTNKTIINVSSLRSGIYLVKINSNLGSVTKRFVKR